MKTLIIGFGEVGQALHKVLAPYYEIHTVDQEEKVAADLQGSIMHICFPYSEDFVAHVKKYQELYKPKHTVIHSTVPVGTSRQCSAVHSPIRGIHPNLAEGIKTFVKFLGGADAQYVADYFRRAGLRVHLCEASETTELGKLLDTEYYRTCIKFTQQAYELCKEKGANFAEAYTIFNQTYNEGYTKLDRPEFVRPVLQPIMTPIGGHCLEPNHELLKQ